MPFVWFPERRNIGNRTARDSSNSSIALRKGNNDETGRTPFAPARGSAVGRAKSCIGVAALVDTNVIVYRYDPRFPDKQRIATDLLRVGIAGDSVLLPHQAIVEFVAVVTRPLSRGGPLLSVSDARREAEELLLQFEVLYPDEELLRTALRGAAAYGLAWFDAHMWAYAERYGLRELVSEDFEDGRLYGTVQAINPFKPAG
jgi:predicted nucleic acid-binding protein